MRNYIVRYPGKKDGVIVLASHYETNYPLKDIDFVGANDGACTTALLIELGNYLRAHPPQGYSVWLVFDDGEEAVKAWSTSDSLYGTRHLAAKWSPDGTLAKIKAFIVADMIGDKDLNIDREENSTPWLEDLLRPPPRTPATSPPSPKTHRSPSKTTTSPSSSAASPSSTSSTTTTAPTPPELPDGYHHTAQDTIDKISPKSLQISADLFLETIRLINLR